MWVSEGHHPRRCLQDCGQGLGRGQEDFGSKLGMRDLTWETSVAAAFVFKEYGSETVLRQTGSASNSFLVECLSVQGVYRSTNVSKYKHIAFLHVRTESRPVLCVFSAPTMVRKTKIRENAKQSWCYSTKHRY